MTWNLVGDFMEWAQRSTESSHLEMDDEISVASLTDD